MYPLLRSLLFALDAERSHQVAIDALKLLGALPGVPRPRSGATQTVMGLRFANAVGLAAGLDKDAVAVRGLSRLGFGFVEVGTVTPLPQPGNPRPRLFRLPQAGALINRMGFNNHGVAAMTVRLRRLRERHGLGQTLLGVNVGKNKNTPLEAAADDYRLCMEAVYPYADYLTLNLSSPNTPGLRSLQTGAALIALLTQVRDSRQQLADRHGHRVPLALKVAPDLSVAELTEIAEAVARFGVDAVIATNTTITRPDLAHQPLAAEAGGLSGLPLAPLSRATVRALRGLLPEEIPIIGVGGIASAAAGAEMFACGASLLQIYTGFIYQGPGLVRDLARIAPPGVGRRLASRRDLK